MASLSTTSLDRESQGFSIDTERLGEVLAKCIKDGGLEQKEFAELAGLAPNTISNYVNGRLSEKQLTAIVGAANLGNEQAVEILDALGIDPGALEGVGGGIAQTFKRAASFRDDHLIKGIIRLMEDRLDELEKTVPPGGAAKARGSPSGGEQAATGS